MAQSIDLAVPSFLLEEENQIYVLIIFFITVIMVPLIIIAKTRDQDDEVEVLDGTRELLIQHFMQTIDKNITKKQDKISDNQWADIFSESVELQMLCARYDWKINFRTFVKQRSDGHTLAK